MRTIDITTTQNVTIEYELAALWDRFFALLIDLVAIFALLTAISFIITMIYAATDVRGYEQYIFFIFPILIIFFYRPIMELTFNGQSLGKMALGIKVVKVNGEEPDFGDHVTRWIFRLIDIWMSAGAIGSILITTSPRAQRLGGVLSNTTVVRLRPQRRVGLKEILKINTLQNYQPTYTNVTTLSEDDMLMVKRTVERTKKYRNKAHRETVGLLVQNLAEKLEIAEDQLPANKMAFLRTIINDYIVLTR